ncbi:MAG: hypothetical protein IJO76_01655 [Clostridia bacterium]|nr:hypothetical protein [Clostridia bacterium]
MDDLSEKLTQLLTSPEGMAKIQSVMSALGGEGEGEGAQPPKPAEPSPVPPMPSGIPDLAALTKVLPLLSNMGQDNEDTRLLQALRPYLHGEREQRLDETMRLLKMMRLLPLLQEQGILGGSKHGG